MSELVFDGIVVSDKGQHIDRSGELVYIRGWLLAGSWSKDDERLMQLRESYGKDATIREDARGVYLEIAVRVFSIAQVRGAKRRLARKLDEHLGVVATIQ